MKKLLLVVAIFSAIAEGGKSNLPLDKYRSQINQVIEDASHIQTIVETAKGKYREAMCRDLTFTIEECRDILNEINAEISNDSIKHIKQYRYAFSEWKKRYFPEIK